MAYTLHYTAKLQTLGEHPRTVITVRFPPVPTPEEVQYHFQKHCLGMPDAVQPLTHYRLRTWRVRKLPFWTHRSKVAELRARVTVDADGGLHFSWQ